MTGAGRLETEPLVIAQPELTCDDGTIPLIGPPPQAELANFALRPRHRNRRARRQLRGRVAARGLERRPGWADRAAATALRRRAGCGRSRRSKRCAPPRSSPTLATPTTRGRSSPNSTEDDPRHTSTKSNSSTGSSVKCWAGRRTCSTRRRGLYERSAVRRLGRRRAHDQRYLRCAPGRTNPLYPPGPGPGRELAGTGRSCTPTLDDLRYETVSLDLAQLDRQGRDGIWVVNGWRRTAPFAQADPAVVEAQGRERLEEFLAARIAGTGAEGHVRVGYDTDVPLLYATTSGAPYERYEIERVDGPRWPDGLHDVLGPAVRRRRHNRGRAGDQLAAESVAGCGWMTMRRPRTASRSSCPTPPPTVRSPFRRRAHGRRGCPGKALPDGQAPDMWIGGLWRPRTSWAAGSASSSSIRSPTTRGAQRTAGPRCSRRRPMQQRSPSRSSPIPTSRRRHRSPRASVGWTPCRSTSPLLPAARPAGSE